MNILVRTASGRTIVRSDTTREKNSEDFWLPEDVSAVSWSPVFFVRICRPGKAIGRRFASRYYDLWSCGILLYPEDYVASCEEGYALASCLDRTSYLPMPEMQSLPAAGTFRVAAGDKEIYSGGMPPKDEVDNAVAEASLRTLVRSGDYLCIELAPRSPLFRREESPKELRITATLPGAPLLSFSVKA